MTTYQNKLHLMTEFIGSSFDSPEDVTTFLEISIEDLVNLFPDKLVKMYYRVYVPDFDEQGELNDAEEDEAWSYFNEDGASENIRNESEEDFE